MENRAHALAAGVFVILLTLAIAVSVWWLSGKREATKPLLLVATYNINGLNPQAQVRYRGLRSGKVESIQLDPSNPHRILVRVSVAENVPISRKTKAELNTQGVTGLAYIQLDDDGEPGPDLEQEADGVPRLNLRKANIEAITDSATAALNRLNVLLERVNGVLSSQNMGLLNKTLANLESASGGVDKTMKEAPRLVADLRRVLNAVDVSRLQAILANVDQSSAEAKPTLIEARRLLTDLGGLSRRLDTLALNLSGEESDPAGATLPQLNRLVRDLSANSRQLGRTLERLERTPQSVLFGTAPLQPGPGEPGFGRESIAR